jgi:predicted P-loop ATPase
MFRGLDKGGLRRVVNKRLRVQKEDREAALKRRGTSNWEDKLKTNTKGEVEPTIANVALILRNSPAWKGKVGVHVLAYNEFTMRFTVRRTPPFEYFAPGTVWEDHHDTLARIWFQDAKIKPTLGDVGRAVQLVARDHPYHPVRDYLDASRWDGVVRADTWLIDFFGAPDTAYVRAISPRWLISAVARVFQPGCQVDHVLTLEGPQGRRSSTALRVLAGDEWFSDDLSEITSKDAKIETIGAWIFELPELDVLLRTRVSAIKGFLTRRWERFRFPHATHTSRLPRQCVFAATVNPPADGRYLKDQTGNRRWWPVHTINIDIEGLKRVRDNLWAEALFRYRRGDKWHLETPELEALAVTEQALRTVVCHEWLPEIREYLETLNADSVTVWAVLSGVFGISREEAEKRHTPINDVAKILKNLGWHRRRSRNRDERENRYYSPLAKKV